MKYLSEFRDAELVKSGLAEIRRLITQPIAVANIRTGRACTVAPTML